MAAYYNEIDPYAAQWLRNLIAAGHIVDGFVDERSIVDVRAADLKGFTQCHFFAGIGGWSHALRLAGWSDDRPVWTGSCPCQPFSSAGKQEGHGDERHLWPHWLRLIRECRPATVFGEQVAGAIAFGWLDEVLHDLENEAYACAASILPACSVGAPHRRDRLWFVADGAGEQQQGHRAGALRVELGREALRPEDGQAGAVEHRPDGEGHVANAESSGSGTGFCRGETRGGRHGVASDGIAGNMGDSQRRGAWQQQGLPAATGWEHQPFIVGSNRSSERTARAALDWVNCPDGKTRPVKSGLRLLANDVPCRMGRLRAYGNAIVPQVAAEFIKAYGEINGHS